MTGRADACRRDGIGILDCNKISAVMYIFERPSDDQDLGLIFNLIRGKST